MSHEQQLAYLQQLLDNQDGEFYLDDDVDLESPLLNSMLSDRQLAPGLENVGASTTTVACMGTVNLEPIEDDWEILRWGCTTYF